MRYIPPNGTAGLARSAVNGISRLPSPPARTIASTSVATNAETSSHPRRQPGAIGGVRPFCRFVTQDASVDAPPPATDDAVRIDLLTREYPPEVYGGAPCTRSTWPVNCARTPTRVHCLGGPRAQA